MKKIIKIAIIIFLHSTFYTKDDKSRESKNSLRLHGLKTAAAAAVGAAGAIGLKHLAQKSNLASKVRIQPFNKIFQGLEQNSIKNVGFSGALLAAGLYGTYTIYDYFKNKRSGTGRPRKGGKKGNGQQDKSPVAKVNAEGNKVEIVKPKDERLSNGGDSQVENIETHRMQEEGSNSASKKEELSQESKSSGTAKGLLGGQTGENPSSDSPATEANEGKKEQKESPVIQENIEYEKSENVFEAEEEEMPNNIIRQYSPSEPKIQETENKKEEGKARQGKKGEAPV